MQHEPEHQERQVVCVIHKGTKQQIQVSLANFRGRTFGDLRLYVTDKNGVLIPTQRGITVGLEQLDELEEAVGRLRDASDQTTQPF